MRNLESKISIVEVGLRDGLQNEAMSLSAKVRSELALGLAQAGVKRIELGSFVRADRVPQMANSQEVVERVLAFYQEKQIAKNTSFSVLVPNMMGMEEALDSGINEIAIFAASSESFSQKNINCSISESFERFLPVIELAHKKKIRVRGYLSTCFGCPYEGRVSEKKVVELAYRLFKLGCYEVSIGDTIGVANPRQVETLFKKLKKKIPTKYLAGHFHDTRGTALANILKCYELGVRVFDSSIGGLGGCPYAPGASGNVSTEDVVYMFQGMGVKTGIDLRKLIEVNQLISIAMGKPLSSKVSKAGLAKPLGKIGRPGLKIRK